MINFGQLVNIFSQEEGGDRSFRNNPHEILCFLKEPSWRISFVFSAELSEVFCLANWWLFYSLRGKYREFTATCFQLWTGIMWKQFIAQKKNYYPWNVTTKDPDWKISLRNNPFPLKLSLSTHFNFHFSLSYFYFSSSEQFVWNVFQRVNLFAFSSNIS